MMVLMMMVRINWMMMAKIIKMVTMMSTLSSPQASSPTGSCDSQREEKNLASLRNKLTAAETKVGHRHHYPHYLDHHHHISHQSLSHGQKPIPQATDLEKLLKAETPDAQAEVVQYLLQNPNRFFFSPSQWSSFSSSTSSS